MSNVKKLTAISGDRSIKPSGEDVIARLEEALAMAKHGGVSNVVVVATMDDGCVMDCWANGKDPFLVVGGIESIKREFMDSAIEAR